MNVIFPIIYFMRTIMTKNLLSLGGSAVAAFLFIFSFSSCHDEEVANTSELAYRHAYEDNFVKFFGEVSPNKSWDMSSYGRRFNDVNTITTRAGSYNTIASSDGYYYADPATILSISQTFPEHGTAGTVYAASKFLFQTQSESCTFDVAYIYQGFNEPVYDFCYCIQTGTDDPVTGVLYQKGDVEVKKTANSPYEAVGYYNHECGTIYKDNSGYHIYENVRSEVKTITVPAYSTLYFYLKMVAPSTTSSSDGWGKFAIEDDMLTSIDDISQITLITSEEIQYPEVPEGNTTYILACEDLCRTHKINPGGGISLDYNDMVIMLSGNIPNTVNPDDYDLTIQKRYMIEDLNDFDFDFNDIVMDVEDYCKYSWVDTDNNGHLDMARLTQQTQKASFRLLCGTLPFQVSIGSKDFNIVTDPTDIEQTNAQLNGTSSTSNVTIVGKNDTGITPTYNYTYTYYYSSSSPTSTPFWDPDNNNIIVKVWTERKYPGSTNSTSGLSGGDESWQTGFPAEGEVPYIIAVDQNDDFIQPEGQHIPSNWVGGDMSTN